MSKSLILAIVGLGLAAGGYVLLSKSSSEAGGSATPQAKERPKEPAAAGEGMRAPAPDAKVGANATGESDRKAATTTLEGVTGVAGFLLPEREVTPLEKLSIRELGKLHQEAGGDGGIVDPFERPPGTDADSLEVKFGAMDVATLQQEHASRRAILKWQSEGPFEDKTLEILPAEQRRVMEIEMEWLEQRILYP